MRLAHLFTTRLCAASTLALLAFTATLVAQEAEPVQDTVITSDRLEMVGLEDENHFFFYDNVVVTGTNLKATANEMTVIAARAGESDGSSMGELGTIAKILLVGNVVITQAGREATAGKAEIFPRTGKVVLTENPIVRDSEGTVTGERIELYKNEKKARVFGEKGGARPTVILPGFQDIGYQEDQ